MCVPQQNLSSKSDQELLEVWLPSSAVRELITEYGNVQRVLLHAKPDEVARIRGIGPVKAKQLRAICELAKRLYQATTNLPPVIKTPQHVYNHMLDMQYLQREEFRVIYLSTKNHILAAETVTSGTLNSAVVDSREVFRRGIRIGAASIILTHNHPSGDPTPSHEDVEVTKKIIEAGKCLEIPVLDHCVIGQGRYTSFKEKGIM